MDPEQTRFVPELRQEDLIRFFKAHEIPCPVCQNDKWGVTSPAQPMLLVTLSPDGIFNVPPYKLDSHGAICSSCGYIRLHAHVIVKEWLDANPE